MNIRGDINGTSSPYFGGAGKVVLSGTGTQTISGTVRMTNLDIANTSGGGVVVPSGSTLRIEPTGVVTFLASSRMTNSGSFILSSNSSSTAKIAAIPTSASFTGNLTMQRFMPYTTGYGSWYFMSSPVGGKNFTDWVDNFKVVGLSTGFGTQGGGILSSAEPERSSIFKYVESNHNQRIDTAQKIGWTIPASGDNILPGTGYRTYVDHYSNASHLFDNTGSLTRNDVTFPTLTNTDLSGACVPSTFLCNEASNRGWNLLGNPYPSDIDWDVTAGWTKPGAMGNAWYRWHASANGYGVYTSGIYAGTTPIPSNPNLIPSSQAFFVRLTSGTSASLVVKEAAKSTAGSGAYLRTNAAAQLVRVHLAKSTAANAYGYDAVIRFIEGATDGNDMNYDFSHLNGSQFNISVPVMGENMSIASYAPVGEYKVIPLTTNYLGSYGNYLLKFTQMETLLENQVVYLRDNLLETLTEVTADYVYNYTTHSSDGVLADRFELVFHPQEITSVKEIKSGMSVNIYPNPSESKNAVTIALVGFDGSSASIEITDAMGRKVFSDVAKIQSAGISEYKLTEKLSAGVYTVKTTGSTKSITRKMVIK